MLQNFDMDIFLSEVVSKFGVSKTDIWKRQFSELTSYLKDKGFSVSLEKGCGDEVMWEEKIIKINSHFKWEKRYYHLLHEAGHIIISEKPDVFSYDYPYYIDGERPGRRGHAYKISTIGEEIEAWKIGRRLGDKDLNHFVNYEKYDKLMSDCVMTYVYWASEE